MDINYELYKVFYYVATSLSFSDASKQLFISQSAVSQSIKTLEKKLEQPLFIRSTKKVSLTPAGKILLKHIEPAMNLIQRGESTWARTAPYRSQRHHLPVLSGSLFKGISQKVPKYSNQSDQRHLTGLRCSSGTWKSGFDCDQFPKCTAESILYTENRSGFFRRIHCQSILFQSQEKGA